MNSSLPQLHIESDDTFLVQSHVRKILPLMSDEAEMGSVWIPHQEPLQEMQYTNSFSGFVLYTLPQRNPIMKMISTNRLKQKVCLLSIEILMNQKATMISETLVQLLLRQGAATVEKKI